MTTAEMAVVGCIHETYPMMATCTEIQPRTMTPVAIAMSRSNRERAKTTMAEARNAPPTTTNRIERAHS